MSMSIFNSGSILNSLNKYNTLTSKAMQQLSSGYSINTASDNPSGTVISSKLHSQYLSTFQAVRNSQETNNVLGIAEGGLSQVSDMLSKMKELATHAANSGVTSSSQVSADQSELNGMLNAVNNIAATTSYGSKSLLNGTSSIAPTLSSGSSQEIVNLSASNLTASASGAGAGIDVSFSGNQADQAEKAYLETNFSTGDTTLQEKQEFTLTGNGGAQSFSFDAGTSIEDMADTINQFSEKTGVTAYATDSGSELRLASQDYGSSQNVSVSQSQGSAFAAAGSTASDTGQDVTVNINGEDFTGNGLEVTFNSGDYSGTLNFNPGEDSTASDPAVTTVAQLDYSADELTNAAQEQTNRVDTSKGGNQLQLGTGSGGQNRQDYSLPDASLSNLGKVTVDGTSYSMADLFSGGTAALSENPEIAMKVIDQAISDVSGMRSNIGAYQANTLSATSAQLEIAAENILATESGINSADMAEMITQMTSSKLMEQVNLATLQKANSSMGNMLKLLGAQ